MVKKRSYSASENEDEDSGTSKAQINKLLHNASLITKNQLLKHKLKISELNNILNGDKEDSESDLKKKHTDSELGLKQSIQYLSKSSKLKKKAKKKHELSNSSDSSEEQEIQKPTAIKEEMLSEDSAVSDDINVPVPTRESVSSYNGRKTKKNKSEIQKVKYTESNSDNEETLQSEDKFEHDGNRTNKSLFQKSSQRSRSALVVNKKDIPISFIGKKDKTISSSSESSDSEQDASNSYQHEKTIEDTRRIKDPTKLLNKNKVNVLQNICVTPPKNKSLKEKLEGNFPGIKQEKMSMSLDFSNTDDIYLFRIPKNVDPSSLQNIEFSLTEKRKIKLGKKYDIEPTLNMPLPTLAVSDNCKILHFKGNFEVEKHVKIKKDPNIVIPETKSVPLPDNLKNRHPLFGSNYKRKIKLSENVKQKVDNAIEILLKKEMKKKKKRKTSKSNDLEENKNETIFRLLNDHDYQDRKNLKQELLNDSACSSTSTENFKNMSKLHETLKRIKSEIVTEVESDDTPEYSSSKKKKKKEQLNNSQDQLLPKASSKRHTQIKSEPSHLSNYEHKLHSTMISNMSKTPSFSPEVSRIAFDDLNTERTPKKPKKSKRDEEKLIISNILSEIKSDLSPKKVKKKKRHQSE